MRKGLTLLTIILLAIVSAGAYFFITQKIVSGEQQLADGQKQFEQGQKMLSEGKAKLANGKQELSQIKTAYKNANHTFLGAAVLLPVAGVVIGEGTKQVAKKQIS